MPTLKRAFPAVSETLTAAAVTFCLGESCFVRRCKVRATNYKRIRIAQPFGSIDWLFKITGDDVMYTHTYIKEGEKWEPPFCPTNKYAGPDSVMH